MIRAGHLRFELDHQRQAPTIGELGDRSDTWGTLRTVRASVTPASGREIEIAAQLDARVSHKITMRWISDLRAEDRFVFQGRNLYVQQIINVEERNTELTVYAEERIS